MRRGLASPFERTFAAMKRILLIGGSGQLGTALRAELAATTIVAPPHAAFDLVNGDPAALLDGAHYDVAINCAAFHNVDTCEREPDKAFAANALAVDRFARACAARDVAFMTISTDYVFAGTATRPYTEADAPGPRTAYGVSKLAGELLTRRSRPKHFIVRSSGVFGTVGTSSKGYTLIDKVLAQAERGEPTRMVADMTFSPSYAPHVARAIHALHRRRAYGTHHVTNCGRVHVVRVRADRVCQSRLRRRGARADDLRVVQQPGPAPDVLTAREHDVRPARYRGAARPGMRRSTSSRGRSARCVPYAAALRRSVLAADAACRPRPHPAPRPTLRGAHVGVLVATAADGHTALRARRRRRRSSPPRR